MATWAEAGLICKYLKGATVKKSVSSLLGPRLSSLVLKVISRADDMGPDADSYVEERLRYLLNEVSDLRIAVRKLTASQPDDGLMRGQTKDSFSYQWAEIVEGTALLGDAQFERQIIELLCKYTDLPFGWFRGKKVLDAGCGIGRWSYAFCKLGAEVTAVDQSASGIEHVKQLLKDQPNFHAQQADILSPLPFERAFDLVWCYGVTHHTGNTKLAVTTVAATVKPGGRLFLMIYGEPTKRFEFREINTYVKHRRATELMNFDEKRRYLADRYSAQQVHGYFDAISPSINDLHRYDEIKEWLTDLGFINIQRTFESRNHHIVADLPA